MCFTLSGKLLNNYLTQNNVFNQLRNYCYFYKKIISDMETEDFKEFAKSMTDYIAEYLENIRDR